MRIPDDGGGDRAAFRDASCGPPSGPLHGVKAQTSGHRRLLMYHAKTRINQNSLRLVEDAREVMQGLPRGYAPLKDQLLHPSG